jgi:hypothetical protein
MTSIYNHLDLKPPRPIFLSRLQGNIRIRIELKKKDSEYFEYNIIGKRKGLGVVRSTPAIFLWRRTEKKNVEGNRHHLTLYFPLLLLPLLRYLLLLLLHVFPFRNAFSIYLCCTCCWLCLCSCSS